MLKVKQASLEWAIAHALRYGDTDVLPVPFEFAAIHHDWPTIQGHLQNADVLNWVVRPHRSLLAPKLRHGFRVVTQLDPLDFLVFAALVHEIAHDIESRRVPIVRQTVYSYRVALGRNGQLFDPRIGYDAFRKQSAAFLDANEEYSYVAVTDIADFYPRIYVHRLENALNASTTKTNHVIAIMRLLSGWNGTESFGIPVGNQPSRILAEALLIDVDEALLAAGIKFVRYNDDYRIFAESHAKAYRHLAFLADVLYKGHGLTLQGQKTVVITRAQFKSRFLTSPQQREVESLFSRFQELISEMGLSSPYERIDYVDLSPDQQDKIDSLNLKGLFRKEAAEASPDFTVIRFILRRMAQLGDASLAEEVIDSLDQLYPAFTDLIEYLKGLRYPWTRRLPSDWGQDSRLLGTLDRKRA